MLVENATSPWGQSWERVFHKHSCIQFIAYVQINVVPNEFTVGFDIRITPTTNMGEFEAQVITQYIY